jgi:hypothetical protein
MSRCSSGERRPTLIRSVLTHVGRATKCSLGYRLPTTLPTNYLEQGGSQRNQAGRPSQKAQTNQCQTAQAGTAQDTRH